MSRSSPVRKTSAKYAVLQVIPRLKEGGVEESTIALARFLKKPVGKVQFVPHVAAAKGPRTAELKALGVKVHTLPLASKNPLVWWWVSRRLAEIIKAEGITLVHARSRACAWPARWAAYKTGVPFITTFHGMYGLSGGVLKRFYNSVMTKGNVTIANSLFTAQHIFDNYKIASDKIIVAPRGFNTQAFNPTRITPKAREKILQELSVPAGVPLLLMVGRLTSWKGQHVLLEALSLMPHRRFVVAFAGGPEGKGTYAADLKGFAKRLGIEDQVRWLGSRPDIPRLLAVSTLAFSCSTRPEAFGRVAVESMAMGVPIIASGHGGSVETIIPGQTGWLVEVGQGSAKSGEIAPQALADVIAKALRNKPKLATMGQNARAHVLASYTEARMCRAEVAAYMQVLGLNG